jgi:hypothetical protein
VKKEDLLAKLEADPAFDYWQPVDEKDRDHVIVLYWGPNDPRDGEPGAQTRVDDHALGMIGWRQLRAACVRGRDVEHITRVTGYFSKVSGWNKGKQGELEDRHRATVARDGSGRFSRAGDDNGATGDAERAGEGS